MNTENSYTKKQVLGFNESDWEFRRSSGYAGYDNIKYINDEKNWIYAEDYMAIKSLKEKYDYEYKLLLEFVNDHLTKDTISNNAISDFLYEKHFK